MTRFVHRHAALLHWLAVGMTVAALLLFARLLPLAAVQQAAQSRLQSLGVWGGVVFVVCYVLATVLLLPGSVLTLAAGAAFELWLGFALVSLSSTLGAALAFLIARHLARSRVERLARRYPKFHAFESAISEGGWKVVVMLRLSPAIPFNVQNYLYGLTGIPFWQCIAASWVAMMPGTLMYVSLGHAAGAAVGDRERTLAEWALLGVGLLATVAVTVYVARRARQKLNARSEELAQAPSETAPTTESPPSPRRTAAALTAAALFLSLAVAAQFYAAEVEATFRGWL